MRALFITCAILLVLAVAPLPIGFYTFLRFAITAGAIAVIIDEAGHGLTFWNITFGAILIIFNPVIPVYLHDREVWFFVDIAAALMFIAKSYFVKDKN